MMQEQDLCKEILRLPKPWTVEQVNIDGPSNRIDIHIGFGDAKRRSVFRGGARPACSNCGQPLPATDDITHHTLRHLSIAGLRTYLHVPAPESIPCRDPDCPAARRWSRDGSAFTSEMEQHIVQALEATRSYQSAASIVGITAGEAREISERAAMSLPRENGPDPSSVRSIETISSDEHETQVPLQAPVPPENHPGWQRLIDGRIEITGDAVALRMMIQRVRMAIANHPSDATRLAGARILRQYFLKHQQRHRAELAQLNGAPPAADGHGRRPPSLIPEEADPCWEQLVAGRITIQTNAVALRMLIQRIRMSIDANPSPTTRMAGTRILRQYFIKNRHRHQAELAQLGGTATPAMPAATFLHSGVPPEAHPVWQRLIIGELEIKTDAVALRMMIQRIRMNIAGNPTDSTRLAGARILRQYFLKHRHRHRAELEQMAAA